jgi:hypothetical protein
MTFLHDNALWDWNLKSGSLKLNSFHLKRSEDCNLNLITVGKLNTEVNSYVLFWQTTILNEQNVSFPLYLQRKECFITVTYIRYISDPFYNYVHFRLLDLNYSPLSALNEANLTSATQTLNFNPTMHFWLKASQASWKITNLQFASLFVEMCR